jgi:hypothetical protein
MYGYLMLPKSEANLFLHLDLALKAIDRGWLKYSEQLNMVYVTHLSGEVKDFSVINDAIDFILVNNSETLNALVLSGVDKNGFWLLPIRFQKNSRYLPLDYQIEMLCSFAITI